MNLAFLGCCALALKDESKPLVPGVTFDRVVGPWEISLNGANLQAALKFNGWPAGVIDPGGGIIAAGNAANEDTFIAAIEADLGQPIEQWMAARPVRSPQVSVESDNG
jgi:hypothetical protein